MDSKRTDLSGQTILGVETERELRDRAGSWPRLVHANIVGGLAMIIRSPRVQAKLAWRAHRRLALGTLAALSVLIGVMVLVDARTIAAMKHLPVWLIVAFDVLSEFGKSGWFLWPIAIALAAVAALASPALAHINRLVLVSVSMRLAFVFTAIAIPGLFAAIIKRVIGRARPIVSETGDPFLYMQAVWRPEYASLPSGHATTAFAAAIAISLVWPRARVIMLIFVVLIAISRVALVAHFPSDVLAGALVGIVGALLVRDWFAARRLGFVIRADASVAALPGPTFARMKKIARRLLPHRGSSLR